MDIYKCLQTPMSLAMAKRILGLNNYQHSLQIFLFETMLKSMESIVEAFDSKDMHKFAIETSNFRTSCKSIGAFQMAVNLSMVEKDLTRMQRVIEDFVDLIWYASKYNQIPEAEICNIIIQIPIPSEFQLISNLTYSNFCIRSGQTL